MFQNTSFLGGWYMCNLFFNKNRTMGNKKQAMNDFNITVNLDANYAPVYF